jgi:unsaturated rhamnogalacturonyl hydrolase
MKPIILTFLFAVNALAQQADVLSVMKKVADWQLANPGKHPTTDWTQGALYAGMMALGQLDSKFVDAMVKVGEKNEWKPGPRVYHADDHAVGQMYCEVFQLRKDPKMIGPMKEMFDSILAKPDTRPIAGAVHARNNKAEPMRYWLPARVENALSSDPASHLRPFTIGSVLLCMCHARCRH